MYDRCKSRRTRVSGSMRSGCAEQQPAAAESSTSREQFECGGVSWSNDGEVPVVQRGDLCRSESFGDRHDRCVDNAEGEIGIGSDEVCDLGPIAGPKVDHLEGLAGTERFEKVGFDHRTAVTLDEVARLGHDRHRHDQRLIVCSQPRAATLMVAVVGIKQRNEEAGVDDDQPVRPSSLFSISS